MLLRSKLDDLKIIVRDLQHKQQDDTDLYEFLFSERSKQNLALIATMKILEINMLGDKIISEDHFLENIAAMMIRKNFVAKNN